MQSTWRSLLFASLQAQLLYTQHLNNETKAANVNKKQENKQIGMRQKMLTNPSIHSIKTSWKKHTNHASIQIEAPTTKEFQSIQVYNLHYNICLHFTHHCMKQTYAWFPIQRCSSAHACITFIYRAVCDSRVIENSKIITSGTEWYSWCLCHLPCVGNTHISERWIFFHKSLEQMCMITNELNA